jgi:hypothetical protein
VGVTDSHLAGLARSYHQYMTPQNPGAKMTRQWYVRNGRTEPQRPCLCRGAGQHCHNSHSQREMRRREREQAAEAQPAPRDASGG